MHEQLAATETQPPGTYPGERAPEIPKRPGPDEEVPRRTSDPTEYPERPHRDVPVRPGPEQPEVPAQPAPQRDAPPVVR